MAKAAKTTNAATQTNTMRLLFITDFTEQFAYRLLQGILHYAEETEQWVVCKMPPEYKRESGMEGVLKYALKWRADVVIGQFDPDDDVLLLKRHGIVTIAQDYIAKFDCIPNITADYDLTGAMAATRFLSRGFQNFAFFGYNGVCWSDERCDGFRRKLESAGFGDRFYKYDRQRIDHLWSYDPSAVCEWVESLPKPCAIMACDDNQASILLQACNVCGVRIPSEVAIIGVDNDEVLCNMSAPPLSSINIDIERGGYEAAAMAERMVRDPDYAGEDIILRPLNIVARMSSNVFATNNESFASSIKWALSDSTSFDIMTVKMGEDDIVEGLRNGLVGVKGGEECYVMFNGKHGFGKKKISNIPANSALAYHLWIKSVTND